MSLCHACQLIPFRAIFTLLVGEKTIHDAFVWYHVPWSESTDESLKRGYIRWHDTISKLRESAASCPLCHTIYSPMEDNWRYKSSVQADEKRPVWLEVPGLSGNPTFAVWIGDARPEALVSGNYRFNTTPSRLALPR